MHSTLFTRILTVGSSTGAEPVVLDTYMQMLACHCDPQRGASSTLRDYLVFREVDVGMPICMAILYWTENIALTPSDIEILKPLEHVANYHVSILNDIFSFEREWTAAQNLGQGAVLVNGVRILADEAVVSVSAAKTLCFALVRAWEAEFQRMAEEILVGAEKVDGRLVRAIAGIERRMTGAEAFSWRTTRYL
jgi:aristolochene synthase